MKNNIKTTIKIYWDHTKPYYLLVLAVIISMVVAVCVGLYPPILYKHFFDTISSGGSASQLTNIIFQVLAYLILGWALWRVTTFADIYLIARVMSNLLNTCFKYLHDHSYDFFSNNFGGSLVRKVNRYSRSYEDVTDQIVWNVLPTIVTMAFILVVLYQRTWVLAAIIFVWTVIYVIFNYLFVSYKMKFDIARAQMDTETSGYLADTVTNHINLKLFSARSSEYKAYHKLTEKLYNMRMRTWNLDQISDAIQGAFMVILEFSTMYAAVIAWSKGYLTIGDFALIQAYLIKIFDNLWGVGKYMRKIYANLADADEMTEILLTPHEVVDVSGAKKLSVLGGDILFDQVSFSYRNNQEIFNKFDLHIKPSERVALIGPSGGGKSTIVKLLLRFFDIQSGSIRVDGQDILKVTQDSLRDNIALVPQDPVLFHRSLMENIRYAKPSATDEEVIGAAKLAHCHEFISEFADGYNTYVGERGIKLSGGERQRVAIARAILKNAPILILDEATSSLDSESERYIQSALKTLMKDKTTIVIAHRLSTIMQMDRIIVLKGGKIAEEGSHNSLLELDKGIYQKLWNIQAGGFANK